MAGVSSAVDLQGIVGPVGAVSGASSVILATGYAGGGLFNGNANREVIKVPFLSAIFTPGGPEFLYKTGNMDAFTPL